MKKVSQEEFEKLIRQIIEGERSEGSVIKELETESRTFNNKISELSLTNPQLYYEFIKARPYKPKERKDINIRGFVIEVLKSGVTVEEICDKYHIGRRTISRKIEQLKKSDKEEDRKLYELYKRIAYKKAHSQKLENADIMKINALKSEDVIGMSDVERRRLELLEIERQYQDLSLEFGKEVAAKKMGYTPNRIYKLLNELYRIEIERSQSKKSQKQTESGQSYRDSIKVDKIKPVVKEGIKSENEVVKSKVHVPEQEGR